MGKTSYSFVELLNARKEERQQYQPTTLWLFAVRIGNERPHDILVTKDPDPKSERGERYQCLARASGKTFDKAVIAMVKHVDGDPILNWTKSQDGWRRFTSPILVVTG